MDTQQDPAPAAFAEFLSWERASLDTIDFKKSYVDMVGDLNAGLMLSEIVYWYLPSRRGEPNKLRVKREGHEWIAIRRTDWWDRTRMSPDQADRALLILVQAGIVIKKVFKFGGDVSLHIRLNFDHFMQKWHNVISDPPKNPYIANDEDALPLATSKIDGRPTEMDLGKKAKSNLPKTRNPNAEKPEILLTETTDRDYRHSLSAPSSATHGEATAHEQGEGQGKTVPDEPVTTKTAAAKPIKESAVEPVTKKLRKRDVVFDAITVNVFKVSIEMQVPKAIGGRAAKLAKTALDTFQAMYRIETWTDDLRQKCATSIERFVKWWENEHHQDNLSLPTGEETFATHYLAYLQSVSQQRSAAPAAKSAVQQQPADPLSIVHKELSPEEREAVLEQIRQHKARKERIRHGLPA